MSKVKNSKRSIRHLLALGVSWVIVPIVLGVMGFLYGVVHYPGSSFFSLNYYHVKPTGTNEVVPLKNNERIEFSFTSQMDNLGTVAVRFVLPKEEAYGSITFRLLNDDSGEVLHTGNYDMQVLYGGNFYPLGFPAITHSKNIRYRVVLESDYAKGGEIKMNFTDTSFISKYHVGKINPLNTNEFFGYFRTKVINLFKDVEFYSYILLYLLPMVLYLVWKIMNNKYVTALLIIFIAYRIYSSVYLPLQRMGYDAELYFKIATLFFVIVKFNIGGSAYFIIALAMFALSTMYVALQKYDVAQGYALWTYYFMALGLCGFLWDHSGDRVRTVLSRILLPLKKLIRSIILP